MIQAKAESARDIIANRGGSSVVCKALSAAGPRVPRSTVDAWYQADRIPDWRQKDVLAIPLAPKAERKGRAA